MRRFALPLLSCPADRGERAGARRRRAARCCAAQARAEQAAAEAETARLEKIAGAARGEAGRLRAQQAAAAQAIEAAEARITAADAQFRLAAAYVAAHRARIAEEQRPVSSLLAGLAVMGQRPPLLTLADRGGVDEFVKVSVLLDSTLPVIRARTRALSAQLAEGQRLENVALAARAELVRSRQALAERRQQFAELEQRAIEQSLAAGGQRAGHRRRRDRRRRAGRADPRRGGAEPVGARSSAALLQSEPATPASPSRPPGRSFGRRLPTSSR